jgi:hypothetical protein
MTFSNLTRDLYYFISLVSEKIYIDEQKIFKLIMWKLCELNRKRSVAVIISKRENRQVPKEKNNSKCVKVINSKIMFFTAP